MTPSRTAGWTTIVIGLCAATAWGQVAPTPPPAGSAQRAEPAATRDVRLATLLGQMLIDPQGRELGRVRDATLDLNNDRVTSLTVGPDGERRDVALETLRPRDRGLEAVPRGASAKREPEPTPPRPVAASALAATAVRDPEGRELGRIEDVVVSFDDLAVRYIVVRVDAAGDARLVPLPLRAFTRQDSGEMRVTVTRAQLDPAPAFTRTAWPRLTDPVYQARLRTWFATVPVRDATSVKSNQG